MEQTVRHQASIISGGIPILLPIRAIAVCKRYYAIVRRSLVSDYAAPSLHPSSHAECTPLLYDPGIGSRILNRAQEAWSYHSTALSYYVGGAPTRALVGRVSWPLLFVAPLCFQSARDTAGRCTSIIRRMNRSYLGRRLQMTTCCLREAMIISEIGLSHSGLLKQPPGACRLQPGGQMLSLCRSACAASGRSPDSQLGKHPQGNAFSTI